MKDIKLTSSGDLATEDNDFAKVSGLEELRQRILLTLQINRGEWFLDQNLGIPWIEALSESDAENILRREIAKVLNSFDEVQEIEKLETKYQGQQRKLRIEFRLMTDRGELNGELEEVV